MKINVRRNIFGTIIVSFIFVPITGFAINPSVQATVLGLKSFASTTNSLPPTNLFSFLA